MVNSVLCNQCDRKLSTTEIKHNMDSGVQREEWSCIACDNDSDIINDENIE